MGVEGGQHTIKSCCSWTSLKIEKSNSELIHWNIFIQDLLTLTHSRLTPSFWKCSQGLKDKTPIIDKKANVPWIILVQKLFQNVDRK